MSQPPPPSDLLEQDLEVVKKTDRAAADRNPGYDFVCELESRTAGSLDNHPAEIWVTAVVTKINEQGTNRPALKVTVRGLGGVLHLLEDHIGLSLDYKSIDVDALFRSLGVVTRLKRDYKPRLEAILDSREGPGWVRVLPMFEGNESNGIPFFVEDLDEAANIILTIAKDMRGYLLGLAVFLKETDADMGPAYRKALKMKQEARLLAERPVTVTSTKLTFPGNTTTSNASVVTNITNGTRTTSSKWRNP